MIQIILKFGMKFCFGEEYLKKRWQEVKLKKTIKIYCTVLFYRSLTELSNHFTSYFTVEFVFTSLPKLISLNLKIFKYTLPVKVSRYLNIRSFPNVTWLIDEPSEFHFDGS